MTHMIISRLLQASAVLVVVAGPGARLLLVTDAEDRCGSGSCDTLQQGQIVSQTAIPLHSSQPSANLQNLIQKAPSLTGHTHPRTARPA